MLKNPSESVQDMSQVFKISSSVHVLVNAIFLDLCHIVVILSYKTYKILISALLTAYRSVTKLLVRA